MTTLNGIDTLDAADAAVARFPEAPEAWPKFETRRVVDASGDDYDIAREELRGYGAGKPWVWPEGTIYFFCDVHADTDAFLRSLVASGGVRRTGPADADIELTEEGRTARFVIGGDCFDKGPENLRLLRAVGALKDSGARLVLLAGNHDVRALVGLAYAGRKETAFAHLFVRMGKKSVPLFREIHDAYLAGTPHERSDLSEAQVRELLFPPADWFDAFPSVAARWMRQEKIAHELRRIRAKAGELEAACHGLGMDLSMLHAAYRKAVELFLEPGGEFAWFFDEMQLALRAGSFLFVHAGVDDAVAGILRQEGTPGLNRRFRALVANDLFELYHGRLGNAFRTKYRPTDLPLTAKGVAEMRQAGLYAIVHGHRNVLRGQRMMLRMGILNLECDATLDANTRRLEGLDGPGGAVTIFRPTGTIEAISTDYPYIKTMDAAAVFELAILQPPEASRTSEEKDMQTEDTKTETTEAKRDKSKKPDKAEVKFDSMMPLEEAISYFEAIIAGMKKGTIHLKQAGSDLVLSPPAHLNVEVNAARKKDREKISFEIEWQTTGGSELTITTE